MVRVIVRYFPLQNRQSWFIASNRFQTFLSRHAQLLHLGCWGYNCVHYLSIYGILLMMNYAAHALNGATAFFVKCRLNKYISRRSQFLLNFNLQQLSQRTLVYVDPRGYLEGCVPTQQHFRVQILVSSGTFLMSLAFAMTSCYMKNFGWCTVFSFQLFCIAEEDTILAKWEQFAAACLVFAVRRAALVLARFSPFFSFPQACASPSMPGPVESRRKELWLSRDCTALALNCRVE